MRSGSVRVGEDEIVLRAVERIAYSHPSVGIGLIGSSVIVNCKTGIIALVNIPGGLAGRPVESFHCEVEREFERLRLGSLRLYHDIVNEESVVRFACQCAGRGGIAGNRDNGRLVRSRYCERVILPLVRNEYNGTTIAHCSGSG